MKKFIFLIISLVNAAVTAVYAAFMPNDIIPIHYGASGAADSYSSKWSIMLLPCILVVFGIGYLIYCIFQEKSLTANKNRKYSGKIVGAIYLLLFVLFWILQIAALSGVENIGNSGANIPSEPYIPVFICIALGAVMVYICNFFPKLEQNSTLGIKTNATLKSENVWKKTHKLGGYLGVLGGIVMFACGIAGIFAKDIAFILMIIGLAVFLIAGCIIPIIYAEVLYNRERRDARNTRR